MKRFNNRAFTLIEILVVAGIIAFFTAIVLPNYRFGAGIISLERSAHSLSQEFRRVQEMAMASREIGKGIVPQGQEFYPKGGFGISLKSNPTEIIVFADCDGNGSYDTSKECGSGPNKFYEKLYDFILESGISISGLFPSSPLTVIFRAPDPIIIISGGSTATITLSLVANPLETKNIKVNSAGLIYVEQ